MYVTVAGAIPSEPLRSRGAELEDPRKELAVLRDLDLDDVREIGGEDPHRVDVPGAPRGQSHRPRVLDQILEVLLDVEAEGVGGQSPVSQALDERMCVELLPELGAVVPQAFAKGCAFDLHDAPEGQGREALDRAAPVLSDREDADARRRRPPRPSRASREPGPGFRRRRSSWTRSSEMRLAASLGVLELAARVGRVHLRRSARRSSRPASRSRARSSGTRRQSIAPTRGPRPRPRRSRRRGRASRRSSAARSSPGPRARCSRANARPSGKSPARRMTPSATSPVSSSARGWLAET